MLECRGLGRTFLVGGTLVPALVDVDLDLAEGSFSVLVGPSGCGKTTLLRLLSNLTEPSSGRIRRAGPMPDGRASRSAAEIGYVFQEPRLMPWLSVARNVGFTLNGRVSKAEWQARVNDVLALMGLSAFARARPEQLSGGMASRVSLARALVTRPRLLLLDEPFAALDALTRRRLQSELIALWTEFRPTVVFVTHDVEEAVLLADTIYRMHAGRIAGRYRVGIPRPRDPTAQEVVALRRTILNDFEAAEAARSPIPPASPRRRDTP